MPANTDASNGKVTLAVIGYRLTLIETTLSKIDTTLEKVNDCVGGLTTQSKLNKDGIGRHEKAIEAMDDKLNNLSSRSNWLDGLNTALAIVAGAVGSVFGGNR